MENKYYIPEISELFIGMEVQIKSTQTSKNWSESFNWYQENFWDLSNGSIQVRVKYLDREDVESLSWKYDNNEEEYPSLFAEYGRSTAFTIDKQLTNIETVWILYYFDNNFITIERIVKCGSGKWDVLFNGIIKNKSELIKLMKQLNIG